MAQSSLAGQHRAAGLPCTPLSLPVRGVPYLRWILASLKEFSGAVFQGQGRPPAGCLSLFLPFPSAATTNTHKKSLLAFPQLAWIRGCVFLSKSLSRTLAWQVRVRKRREERERAREEEREREKRLLGKLTGSFPLACVQVHSAGWAPIASRQKRAALLKSRSITFQGSGSLDLRTRGLTVTSREPLGSVVPDVCLSHVKNVDCSTSPKPDFYKQTNKQLFQEGSHFWKYSRALPAHFTMQDLSGDSNSRIKLQHRMTPDYVWAVFACIAI